MMDAMADGNTCELLGADVCGAEEREVAGFKVGVSEEEVIADGKAQNWVANEL